MDASPVAVDAPPPPPPPPPPPQLGTPPGTPPESPPDSPRDKDQRCEAERNDKDDDGAFDTSVGVVAKSIYKEKRGFLSRLRDASSAKTRSKYAPSDGVVLPASVASLVPADVPQELRPSAAESFPAERVEIVLEEEEPIDVAIDRGSRAASLDYPAPISYSEPSTADRGTTRDGFDFVHQEDDVAPEVVIHSTESDSDSGFATLNPVITSRQARGKRGSLSSAIATGSTAGVSPPVLLSLPIDEEATTSSAGLVLVINALGATGLTKVEKFGTQSTQLEMRLCESTDDLSSGASHLSYLRTAIHKKGGSEAQWNQQFSTSLRSKTKQLLHVAVRTHSKLLVGEATVSFASVGDTLYDQHYPIERISSDGRREHAGHVHLQLRVLPANQLASLGMSNIAPTTNRSARAATGPIPAVLRKGALMFKVPFHTHSFMGSAETKRQWIAVSGDGPGETVCITWCDPIDTTEKSRRLDMCLITEVLEGAQTKAFERLLQGEPSSVAREKDRCFSIISKTRTLDLVASSKEEALIWVDGLRRMIFGDDSLDPQSDAISTKSIEGFRRSAMVARHNSNTTSATAKKQQLQQWRSTVFEFARRGEVDFIAACLHDGCPIDVLETGTGDTLLMLACRLGDAKLVELCLQWRAKNDPHPEFGETALQVAVNAGHADCLGLILKTAAASEMDSEIVNHIDSNNDAPLHVAARKGDLACMQLLLHHGADICVVDEFGRTPLHCAVLSGSLDSVAYLLDVGGDSVLNAGDHDGDTALHYAALAGGESIVKLLLESAADVQSTNANGETALELAKREKHSSCEKLIAPYHHASATVPAVRNEPASSLLKYSLCDPVENDRDTDAMDYGDEDDDINGEDPEAFIDPSNSPVRQGPIEPAYDQDYDNERDYYVSLSARSSSSSSRSTQPISPSARVREVLATQRQRASMRRSMPVPPLHFHSARDDPRSRYMVDVDYSLPLRQAFTERMERGLPHYRSYPHSRHSDYEDYYRPQERPMYSYVDDHGYAHPPVANRSQSMSAYPSGYHQYPQRPYDDYRNWYGPDEHPTLTSRRPSTADAQYPRQYDAWQGSYPLHIQQSAPAPPPPPPPPPSAPADVWDTYYSEEGYPYYVNRVTGQSQWENPYEQVSLPPAIALAPVAPLPIDSATSTPVVTPSISPDAQVRIRHAATRELKLYSGNKKTEEGPPATEPLTPEPQIQLPASPPESPRSKYEARTGMTLSIDMKSPQRQDANRPVYVASPRARSPHKTVDGREAELSDSSFVRSPRASSPRGKSKNVKIIELKRANNLAMALASFKISDRNDQIVQALTMLDEHVVNAELLVCLQRFFPTEEEAAQLRSYGGPINGLGPAERFFFLLLQVPDIAQRIDCFLYKLQFARSYRSVYTKIQGVKRACRDLVENYSFVQALSEFFKKGSTKSLQNFQSGMHAFRTQFLPRVDEKLHSYYDDLQKASEIELLDAELQINRLVSGARSIQAFVDKTTPPSDRDAAAHDTLHRFLAESRGKLSDLEAEYEGLGQWESKVLDLFGESKASCQLASILECLCSMLDKA